MKVRLISDLHTECAPYKIEPHDEDVLIIAGDVSGDFDDTLRMLTDFRDLAPDVHIILILGNHCCYERTINEAVQHWRSVRMHRFYFLEDESVVLQGIRFFGATMWTDLKTDDIYRVEMGLQDFYMIIGLTADSFRVRHYLSKQTLAKVLDTSEEPVVVVAHHLPVQACLDPKYAGSGLDSAFAASDLEDLVAHEKVIYWLHGHTHSSVDITHSGTRILCNPRGRVTMWGEKEIKRENKKFDPNFTFSITEESLNSIKPEQNV